MPSSDLIRCPACRGKRDTMGAGMIFHKCTTCLGVGHIEAENKETDAPIKVKRSKKARKHEVLNDE